MIASEIMLPPHAPEIYLDRATLWNAVESCEKHPKAQLAYSFDIAMQNELTLEENMELARKFVQEQFVKFWEGELFVGLSSKALSTYLFTITKNACCNALERRGIKTVDLSEGLHVAAQEEAEELDEKTVQIVRQALGRLPQRMREVVCCVICESYSYAEAAVKLGISVNTVKTSLRKGMKELREILGNRNDLILLVLCGKKISK